MFMREVYWRRRRTGSMSRPVSRRLILLFLFVILAAMLLFMPLPIRPTYAASAIENAGHTPLFLVGTLFMLVVLRHDFRFSGARLYAYAGMIGVGAGLLSEAIQQPLHRDASWEDVFADAVGVLLALTAYACFDRWSESRRWRRAFLVCIALACIAIYVEPLVNMTRAYVYRNGQFPVLASFDSHLALYWLVAYGANREIRDGRLEVEFEARTYPGVSFFEPVPDWRAFHTMLLEVENPGADVLHLGVRVHDIGHGDAYSDRFNRSFKLAPGERRVLEVALTDVQHAPRNRLMNMAQISDVTLFRVRDSGSRHLRLYSIRLK
jgi:VanZ family protein